MADDKGLQEQALLELFKSELGHHGRLSDALISLAQNTLRVSFLLNGGALIAALSVYSAKGASSALPMWSFGVAAICWTVGLVASAIAVERARRSQREFQVQASNQFRQTGRELLNLPLLKEEDSVEPVIQRGYEFLDQSMCAWRVSIAAFVVGAGVAIISLFFAGAS